MALEAGFRSTVNLGYAEISDMQRKAQIYLSAAGFFIWCRLEIECFFVTVYHSRELLLGLKDKLLDR